MIHPNELLALKSRLLVAADAAGKIASSAQPVRYEEQEYQFVYESLVSLSSDIGRVLAELDVLRGMFYSGVSMFLMDGVINGGVPEPGRDVGAVPTPQAVGGGEGEPEKREGADGGIPESGVPRKRAKRSKPRRNPKGDGAVPEPVGSGDGEVAVDSSKDA